MYRLAWLGYFLIDAALFVLGLPIIAWLLIAKATASRESRVFPGRIITTWAPAWAWVWGNEEDGILPEWYAAATVGPTWLKIYRWTALRNSVNNLRYVRPFGTDADPAKMRVTGNVQGWPAKPGDWFLVRQGMHAGYLRLFAVRGHLLRFWIGWKFSPVDVAATPVQPGKYPTVGFALQLKGGA